MHHLVVWIKLDQFNETVPLISVRVHKIWVKFDWPEATHHGCTVRERDCDRLTVHFIQTWKKLWSDGYILSKDCQTEAQHISYGRTFSRQVTSLHNWRHIRSDPEICHEFGEWLSYFILFIACFVNDLQIFTVPAAAHFIAVYFISNLLDVSA